MLRRSVVSIAVLVASAATAADFATYENGRFGYSIDLPTDFKTVLTPENGDGISLESSDRSTKLSVWGNYLTEGGFAQESKLRWKFEADDGWKFTYEKRGPSWASFSGIKGDRIIYLRQIALCDDAMGNFTLEYPSVAQKRYGPVIERMVKTLKAQRRCD
ncbi:hypothetical protein [Rhizobium mesoamericanum]|uniref:Uncharacterized protein n=1 Tax=Rhizobium mesoamericanum STM3625 TaxID=1211777 RepID=K0PVV6_9HYPH|nr:hypothetical protein [Rhizobium mesoamericanum]CCM75337.1 conserved exported hypothetical protein [Rhizobium mesoamericanum STM3625]